MKIKFLGAAKTVTGSRTLVEVNNLKLLVDCGLFQGSKALRDLNWNCNLKVEELSAIILTHAHIDHSGFLPRIYREGYRGPIYCSKATKELCDVMLLDAAKLQEEDADYANETQHSHHKPALPLYTTADAKEVLKQFVTINQDEWIEILNGISVRLIRSGHILGSNYVQLSYIKNEISEIVTFSGDVGHGRSLILKSPAKILETDFLVLESTYGDRLHQKENPCDLLESYANKVLSRQGVLLIPAFSVGRTQELLHMIGSLIEAKKIPAVPVFVDSPMATSATNIFLNHPEEHLLKIVNNELQSPLQTKFYHCVKTVDESKRLNSRSGPMIIISASGMLTGGRVMHHLKKRITDAKNGILLAGFQAEETKGRLLQEGLKVLRIHHEEYPVLAEILHLPGLSAHADQEDLLSWVSNLARPPKCILVNHGEEHASLELSKKIKERFGYTTIVPEANQTITLDGWEYN